MRKEIGLLAVLCLITTGCDACGPHVRVELDSATDDMGVEPDLDVGDSGDLVELGPDAGDVGMPDPDLGSPDLGVDLGTDGGPGDLGTDAGPDLGPCGMACVPSNPCASSTCDETLGMCVETSLPDGTECGLDTLCVFGECVTRGCGDGYREPGSVMWPREGCDDGNQDDGDVCSSLCEPVAFPVDPASDTPDDFHYTFLSRGTQALAVDGLGYGLLVWQLDYFGAEEIRAMRFDRFGAPLDSSEGILIDMLGTPSNAKPAVVGLASGGFVIAYSSPASGGRDITLVGVDIDGTLGSPRRANVSTAGFQSEPALAALSDSIVVVWEDPQNSVADPQGGARARRFRENLTPLTGDIVVQTSSAGVQSDPTVAAIPGTDEWIVLFSTAPVFGQVELHARRFLGGGGLGNEFVVSDTAELDIQPYVAAVPDGVGGHDYVGAWTQKPSGFGGDIYARTIPRNAGSALGDIETVADMAASAEFSPVIVPYGGGTGYLVAYEQDVSSNPGVPALAAVGATFPTEVMSLMFTNTEGPALAARGPLASSGSVWIVYGRYTPQGLGTFVFLLPTL